MSERGEKKSAKTVGGKNNRYNKANRSILLIESGGVRLSVSVYLRLRRGLIFDKEEIIYRSH